MANTYEPAASGALLFNKPDSDEDSAPKSSSPFHRGEQTPPRRSLFALEHAVTPNARHQQELTAEKKKVTALENYATKLESSLKQAEDARVDICELLRRSLNGFVNLQVILKAKENDMSQILEDTCQRQRTFAVARVEAGLKRFHSIHHLDLTPQPSATALKGGGPDEVDPDVPMVAIEFSDMEGLCKFFDRRYGTSCLTQRSLEESRL